MSENKKSENRILAKPKEEEEGAPSFTAAAAQVAPETQVQSASADLLLTAADPALSEDLALALLKRADLHTDSLEQLAKNANALKSRKVKIALASHPNTPRHISVPLARQLYTFELVKVALSPSVPADVKVAVDDVLISRLKMVTAGERLTLARRASGRVAAALLADLENDGAKITDVKTVDAKAVDAKAVDAKAIDPKTAVRETRVMQIALDNPRLTESLVINFVLRPTAGAALVHAVARHEKWSRRKEIRAALLRTEHLSLARALEFSREIPARLLQELVASSRLPEKIKEQLLREKLA
ncbi:MAG: hypothetical protein WBV41_20465 [Terriglobales bacterium]